MPKDIAAIAQKWSQRASAAGADYTSGAATTTKDWAGLTAAAAPAWEQGVTQAVANKTFAAKVTAAGTDKWRNGVKNKGSQRYTAGVTGAGPTYSNGFGPYLSLINGITPPPRGARGSPQNLNRVAAYTTPLHQRKVSGA